MRVLVTGANGLLGCKLAQLLEADESVEPILTARKRLSAPVSRSSFELLDISDNARTREVFEKHRPHAVVNTAAMTQVDECETNREACWKANVDSVENLIEACSATGARLIHVSTDFIFDGENGMLAEDAVPAPVNYYGESKLAAERLILGSKIEWAILRTVLVYGITSDMSRSNIVLWTKSNLEQGKPIRVVNDQWRTPALAEDLATGCHLAVQKNARGIYNISGKDYMTPYDIAIATADFFKLDKSLISATDSTQFRQPARRPMKTGFIIEKARTELGYEPHSFAEGLAVLARQIKEHEKSLAV